MAQSPNPLAKTPREAAAFDFWLNNPVEAVKAWFNVTPEDYQGDIINDLLSPKSNLHRNAVKSSHGVGKTTTEAWCGWIFLMTRPQARVVATAPTQNQLADVLWPEFAKWQLRMPNEMSGLWDLSSMHIKNKRFPKTWFAVARTSNKQENLQGIHGEHVLILCEEASGIPNPMFEPIEGIMSNAEEAGEEALLLMVGNPTQTSGEFFDAFNKNASLYNRFTVTGDATTEPDRNAGKFYVSKRVTQSYRTTMMTKYGDGAVYDVRVRGVFPKEADDVVIPLGWAEAAQNVQTGNLDAIADPVTLVMDVARFGGDHTTLGVFRKGHCISLEKWPKTSTNQCVDILSEAFHHGSFGVGGIEVVRVIVDEPGVGGGVVDVARRDNIPITPYNGGGGLVKGSDPEDDCRMFANRRARDWWHLRRKMELGQISIPRMQELVDQLASVKYGYNTRNDKVLVESKTDMRDRLGDTASPDLADTIVMGAAPVMGVHNMIPLELLDLDNSILYGEDRPTANMDF